MSHYAFLGQVPRWYPDFGNLIAEPGDVCAFATPPDDGLWAETEQAVNDKGERGWPISSFQPDVNQGEAAEPDEPWVLVPHVFVPNTPDPAGEPGTAD
jgi:hypothetical protein